MKEETGKMRTAHVVSTLRDCISVKRSVRSVRALFKSSVYIESEKEREGRERNREMEMERERERESIRLIY